MPTPASGSTTCQQGLAEQLPASLRPLARLAFKHAIDASLPIHSGGLGVLAGDLLKEASDRALPLVAVGMLYRRGYFQPRAWLRRIRRALPTLGPAFNTERMLREYEERVYAG